MTPTNDNTSGLVKQRECKALDRADFEYIFAKYKFKTEPMAHQYASILWAMHRDCVMFFHDIGTGKTLAALYTLQVWDVKKTLVVCPCSVMSTWEDQVKEHTDLGIAVLYGEGPYRRNLMETDPSPIHVVNYEGLKTIFGKKQKKAKGKGNEFVPDTQAIHKTAYDCIVFDECHHLKTFEALQTQIAYAVADYADKTLMLTGSPIAKDIRDFWSELMVLDGGQTLGADQFMFLHTYMKRMTFEVNRGKRKFAFHEWYPKPGSLETILEKMRQVVIRYDVHECFELPEKIEQMRKVLISEEQRKLMKSIGKDFKLTMSEGKVSEEEIMNTASKMAQVASGFVLIKGEPHYLKKNPKLDDLMDLLTKEITSKVIIFHQYVETAHLIEERLKKAKIKFRSVRGEIPNVAKHIRDFQQKEDIRVLLAHPKSGGEGINLQMANVVIFFDQIYEGSTLRPQCIGRVWRKGQEETCVIIDLMIDDPKAKGDSIDKYIFKSAETKGKLADKVLAWLRDL